MEKAVEDCYAAIKHLISDRASASEHEVIKGAIATACKSVAPSIASEARAAKK